MANTLWVRTRSICTDAQLLVGSRRACDTASAQSLLDIAVPHIRQGSLPVGAEGGLHLICHMLDDLPSHSRLSSSLSIIASSPSTSLVAANRSGILVLLGMVLDHVRQGVDRPVHRALCRSPCALGGVLVLHRAQSAQSTSSATPSFLRGGDGHHRHTQSRRRASARRCVPPLARTSSIMLSATTIGHLQFHAAAGSGRGCARCWWRPRC